MQKRTPRKPPVHLIESSWVLFEAGGPGFDLFGYEYRGILRPCIAGQISLIFQYTMTSLSYPSEEVLAMWSENGNALKLLFDYVGISPESSYSIIPMLGFHGDEPMDYFGNMSPSELE